MKLYMMGKGEAMRGVNKWLLIPALVLGLVLGAIVFSMTNIDPMLGLVVSSWLAFFFGWMVKRSG